MLKRRKNKVAAAIPCPIGACMELLGGAWTPNVIWYLSGGARRFSELAADMAPISAKMLSQRLKALEEKGVVSRTVLDTSPPSVEYALTDLGREIVPAIEAIAQVGYKLRARQRAKPAPRGLKRLAPLRQPRRRD
ncbi:MAG: helix-turn-helix domain-containing protein [Hyphomonadaceae bacterium]|nr:helix-turn-helix domain-containing protein [Hyphomonadaceae bacterium]